MTLRPLNDRVVVRRGEAERQSAGGIVLPDTASKKPERGAVVAVGPGALDERGRRHTPTVVAGDDVLFAPHAGTEIRLGGETLVILRESEILAVVER